jgi:hypothetical protein
MKTLQTMGQMISAEQANVLLARVLNVIRENVTDRDALAGISRGISQLVHAGDDRG